MYIHPIFFIYTPIACHLGFLRTWTILNDAAVNIRMHICLKLRFHQFGRWRFPLAQCLPGPCIEALLLGGDSAFFGSSYGLGFRICCSPPCLWVCSWNYRGGGVFLNGTCQYSVLGIEGVTKTSFSVSLSPVWVSVASFLSGGLPRLAVT